MSLLVAIFGCIVAFPGSIFFTSSIIKIDAFIRGLEGFCFELKILRVRFLTETLSYRITSLCTVQVSNFGNSLLGSLRETL